MISVSVVTAICGVTMYFLYLVILYFVLYAVSMELIVVCCLNLNQIYWNHFTNRHQLKDQLLSTSLEFSTPTILLLETVVTLIDPGLPWTCKIVSSLLQQKLYLQFREIILTGKVHFLL